jgi:ribonuclease BN (tRNA processing enzyme)
VKLTVLGCGTASLVPDQACSGYHVSAGQRSLLMDCGGGVLLRMRQAGLDHMAVNDLLLSHVAHPDHVGDVPLLLFAWNYNISGARTSPALVLGPPGTADFLRAVQDLFPATVPREYSLEVREVAEGEVRLPGMKIVVRSLRHGRVAAVGFRLEEGAASLAYSGDTAYCSGLVELCRSAGLALVDCSFPAGQAAYDSHLTARDVGRLAAASGPAAVMITHRYPVGSTEEVERQIRESYAGRLLTAADLMSVDIPLAAGAPHPPGTLT